METHAIELLNLAIWVLCGLGSLIVVLLGGIFALAKWGGLQLLERLAAHENKIDVFQRQVADVGAEIKQLLTNETRLLREAQHLLAERVGKLEAFRDFVHRTPIFGRRREDQDPGDD